MGGGGIFFLQNLENKLGNSLAITYLMRFLIGRGEYFIH